MTGRGMKEGKDDREGESEGKLRRGKRKMKGARGNNTTDEMEMGRDDGEGNERGES